MTARNHLNASPDEISVVFYNMKEDATDWNEIRAELDRARTILTQQSRTSPTRFRSKSPEEDFA